MHFVHSQKIRNFRFFREILLKSVLRKMQNFREIENEQNSQKKMRKKGKQCFVIDWLMASCIWMNVRGRTETQKDSYRNQILFIKHSLK